MLVDAYVTVAGLPLHYKEAVVGPGSPSPLGATTSERNWFRSAERTGSGFAGHGARRGSSPFVAVRGNAGIQSSTWTKRSNDPPSRSTTARSEYR